MPTIPPEHSPSEKGVDGKRKWGSEEEARVAGAIHEILKSGLQGWIPIGISAQTARPYGEVVACGGSDEDSPKTKVWKANMAHDVFISYASEDKATADATCAALEAKQIRCWIAPRDARPSSDYGEEIIEGIKESRLMVVVFSNHANLSAHVKNEVERAVSNGIPIIPFRIEDVLPKGSLELHLSRVHWLDALTPPLEAHLKRLIDIVERVLQDPEQYESMLANRGTGKGFLLRYRFHILTAVSVLASVIAILAFLVPRETARPGALIARLPELSDDIVGSVADSLFPGYERILGHRIVKTKQLAPVLFLVLGKGKHIILSAIKNVNERWQRVWDHTDDINVLGTSTGEIKFDEEELLLSWEGCMSGWCPDSWGVIIFDLKANDGWAVKCVSDINRPTAGGVPDFPLGFPADLYKLLKYQTKFMELKGHHLLNPTYGCSTTVLQALPGKIMAAPFPEGEKSRAAGQFSLECQKSLTSGNVKSVDRIYRMDTDGSGRLDWIVLCNQWKGDTERVFVCKNGKSFPLQPDNDAPGNSYFWVARYPLPNAPPLLVLAGRAGASGNFGFTSIYQWNGEGYRLIRDQDGRMKKEFKFYGRWEKQGLKSSDSLFDQEP